MAKQQDQEQAKLGAEFLGKKIGLLIASLDISDEEKDAFTALLPEMNLEQMIRLAEILEQKYLASAGKDADKELHAKLTAIQDDWKKTSDKINGDTLDTLNDFEKSLPKE